MKGAKCQMAAPIHRASTSQGSHVTWCFRSFALMNPARRKMPSLCAYNEAAIPLFLTDPSVTIHSTSSGLAITTVLQFFNAYSEQI